MARVPLPSDAENAAPSVADLEDLEIRLLLQAVYERYGYDFRDYAPTSLRRRLRRRLADEKLSSISELQARVLHEPGALERLVGSLAVSVTGLFRQPGFYRAFRAQAAPILKTYPVLRIWHAGCATGEEVYSMAIVLEEEGLLERAQIYATDINGAALEQATLGRYPIESLRDATAAYHVTGGRRPLSEYYDIQGGSACFRSWLRRNVVFALHNLATDGSFNEFNVIVCRNVLIYFNRPLQERVHRLIYHSLERRGFLGLGDHETIRFTPHEDRYEVVDWRDRLYRKIG